MTLEFNWIHLRREKTTARKRSRSSTTTTTTIGRTHGDESSGVRQKDSTQKRPATNETTSSPTEAHLPPSNSKKQGSSWIEMFQQYKAAYLKDDEDERRSKKISFATPKQQLQDWVVEQRRAHENKDMLEERLYLLNSIGIEWSNSPTTTTTN